MVKGFEEAEEKYDVIEDEQELRSKPYERIFDTEYYWSVPYIVDVEKYKKAFNTRMTDDFIGSLYLVCEIENGYQVIWPCSTKEKTLDSEEWGCDCFQFHYDDLDKFKEFVRKITDTFIKVDNVAVSDICLDKERQIENINKQKEELLRVSGNSMYYDAETNQLVVSEDVRINIDALVPDNATLEKVTFDENAEENLKLYVRLMTGIKNINVNYVIIRDENTGSVKDGTV